MEVREALIGGFPTNVVDSPCSSPPAPVAEPWIILELGCQYLRPACSVERQGLPSSQGILVIIRPVLRPRRDPAGCGPISSCLAWPPRLTKTRAHNDGISGLDRTALTSLSTLRRMVAPPPRKTRFWLLVQLGQAGFVPEGFSERFQSSSLYLPSKAYLTQGHHT